MNTSVSHHTPHRRGAVSFATQCRTKTRSISPQVTHWF